MHQEINVFYLKLITSTVILFLSFSNLPAIFFDCLHDLFLDSLNESCFHFSLRDAPVNNFHYFDGIIPPWVPRKSGF